MKKESSRRAPATINPHDVTAVILARNEERNLPRVLASLPAGMPAFVLDHESADGTAQIARERGAAVLTRPFRDFVDARTFALQQVRTPWTLMIDSDEVLDEQLAAAILSASGDAPGYVLRRDTFYCGRRLRMWRGEPLVRLFKTNAARLQARPASGGSAPVHERWVVDGETAELPGTLLHYSYASREQYVAKFEEYTAIEAAAAKRSSARVAAEALKMLPRFAWYALRRGAILDGFDGLYVAWRSAAYPFSVQWKCRA